MASTVEEEHEALLQFLYIAPIGLVQTRTDGEILMINPLSAQLLLPLSPDGGLSNLFTALQDLAPDLRHLVQTFQPPYGMVCDGMHLHTGAGNLHAQANLTLRAPTTPITAPITARKDAQVLSLSVLKLDSERLMAVITDVTQSVRRDRELRHSQAWINTLVTGLADYALAALDASGRVVAWNASIGRITGFDAAAVAGRSCALFYPADGMPQQRVLDRLAEADRSGWSLDEGWRVRADGSRYWGSCLMAPLHAPDAVQADDQQAPPNQANQSTNNPRSDERAYSLIIRDISDRREATQALWKSVSCDHLTGLLNRRAFFEAAGIELQRWTHGPRPISLLMIDADDFKNINDRHGHAAGDAILRHLAAGLGATFRAIDVVARLGGEAFVVLLPGTPLDGAEVVASRLCQLIAGQSVMVDAQPLRCTLSIGVATMDEGVNGVDALIQRADRAMVAAKDLGRNRVQRWHAGLQAGALSGPGDPAL